MKKNRIITILAVLLLIASLIGSLFLNDSIGARVANVVTIITAIIGAIALFIQFKNDKTINKASFLLDYNRSFYNDYQLGELFSELDKSNCDENYVIDYNKYRADIVKYFEWIETMASLVERNVIDLYMFDNIFAYRFFVIVNNKVAQENELIKYKEYYRGVYYLYDVWYKFETKRGLKMPLAENGLHLTEGYEETLEQIRQKLK